MSTEAERVPNLQARRLQEAGRTPHGQHLTLASASSLRRVIVWRRKPFTLQDCFGRPGKQHRWSTVLLKQHSAHSFGADVKLLNSLRARPKVPGIRKYPANMK